MNIKDLIFKYIARPEGGLFEKLSQDTVRPYSVKTCSLAHKILPKHILRNIHVTDNAVYRGTIGIIYVGIYKDKKV